MIVLDASVALKWFIKDEPLGEAADAVLAEIESDPSAYLVPEFFMNELLAVLSKAAPKKSVQEALTLVEDLGLARIANGHELLQTAASLASDWKISGYDAVYLALAALTGGVWLTADERAARRVARPSLVRVLGR